MGGCGCGCGCVRKPAINIRVCVCVWVYQPEAHHSTGGTVRDQRSFRWVYTTQQQPVSAQPSADGNRSRQANIDNQPAI